MVQLDNETGFNLSLINRLMTSHGQKCRPLNPRRHRVFIFYSARR